ncbi:MAG: ABC transporter permease, partial [Abitibacteriaceae bacterium]|nr:ABC transporter permease [Abditibacteriaceae bacterium]
MNRRTATPDTLLPLNSSTSQPSSVVSRKPYKTIEPRSGLQAINLRQLWRFRDLLLTLAERDIKLRYRQTALGIIWVILQPLIAAGIFSFVFGGLAKMPSGGIPYFVFSYAGLLGWNVFSNTLTKCSTVLIQNSQLISKVFFPRLVLPLSTVFSTLIDFGVALGMMVVLMVLYRVAPSAGLILLPVWLILISLLALGVGLYAAALTVSYRDIQYIIPVVIQFLLFGSPVAYAVPHLREPLRTIYY